MTAVLVLDLSGGAERPLQAHLAAAGLRVDAVVSDCGKLVQSVVRHAPELVVAEVTHLDGALLQALGLLTKVAPLPVLLFTPDHDTERMARAMAAGVHALVVGGYATQRLPVLVQLAQLRFQHEEGLREQLREAQARLDERKVIDRAKGILMRARQLSDDEAYELLRSASMHTNQRLGQVSRQVIDSARIAECLNRAGQLRMLSQRLVQLRLLQAGGKGGRHRERVAESVQRIEDNLLYLERQLPQAAFGDALAQIRTTWSHSAPWLAGEPQPEALVRLDGCAETLLQQADRLVTQIELGGAVSTLRVLNLAGRQRMLSQRYAKYILLELLGLAEAVPGCEAAVRETRADFEEGLRYLNGIPLTHADIRALLSSATQGWEQMLAVASGAARVAGRDRQARLESLASASESLLQTFEALSSQYETSMQMLMG